MITQRRLIGLRLCALYGVAVVGGGGGGVYEMRPDHPWDVSITWTGSSHQNVAQWQETQWRLS